VLDRLEASAYATDISSTFCAPPTCSAASATAARSSIRDSASQPPPSGPTRRAGAPENVSLACLRVMSMVVSGSAPKPSALESTANTDTPAGARAATSTRSATCPSVT
jgi:hypothetical protein